MKKIVLAFAAALVGIGFGYSQSIPNAGFETWNNVGTYEDPDNWVTINLFSAFGLPVTVSKSVDAHSGTYAVLMETVEGTGGDTLPGFIMSGTGNFLSSVQAVAFSARPARMQFYYKGGPATNDTAYVGLSLTKWDSGTNQQIQVGVAGYEVTSVANNYTLVDLTIDYATTDVPDTIMVFATSSNSAVNIPGSNLYLDDVSFVMSGVGLTETHPNQSLVFPNPANETLSIRLNGIEANSIEIFDMYGRSVQEIEFNALTSDISIKHLKAGNYSYRLKNNTVPVSVGKFAILR